MSLHGTKCDLGAAPTNVRSWESNGLNADVAFGPFMTPKQTLPRSKSRSAAAAAVPRWPISAHCRRQGDDPADLERLHGWIIRKTYGNARTTLENYHEEAYCYSHDRHADCRADLRPVRKCGTRVAVELLVRW